MHVLVRRLVFAPVGLIALLLGVSSRAWAVDSASTKFVEGILGFRTVTGFVVGTKEGLEMPVLHAEVVGGAAIGGDHAFLALGKVGVSYLYAGSITTGLSLGYRGYFGSGTVRPGIAVTIDPEHWWVQGFASQIMFGPSVAPMLKIGRHVQLAVPLLFSVVNKRLDSDRELEKLLRPSIQVAWTF